MLERREHVQNAGVRHIREVSLSSLASRLGGEASRGLALAQERAGQSSLDAASDK
jgi:hypothetical protein